MPAVHEGRGELLEYAALQVHLAKKQTADVRGLADEAVSLQTAE